MSSARAPFLLLLAACAGTHPLDRLPETRALRAVSPAPFHVVVAPLRIGPGTDLASGAFGAPLTDADLLETLLANLRALRAASLVTPVPSADLATANEHGADLLLLPTLSALRFEYEGGTAEGLLSSLLWATTWIGGLFVADARYEARLCIDWEIVNPHNGQTVTSLSGSTTSHRLAFVDRNPLFSLGGLQSLFIPPIFTSDDRPRTAALLTDIALAHSAIELTAFLKNGFGGDERELLGELRLESPRNGETIRPGTTLRGALVTGDLVTELRMSVDDAAVAELGASFLPPRSRQQVGATTYRVPLPDVALPIRAGENRIQLEFVAGGRRHSRTLVLDGTPTPRVAAAGGAQ